jgi:outer membrane lipopolysaccharide assembly protein LptE/RlpB
MRRDYAYSETEIVSRTAAEEQIYVELVQEAAWQIIEQLSAAAG